MLLGRHSQMRHRTKRKKVEIVPFRGLDIYQVQKYKETHRPSGCDNCKEIPIYSNDNCWTWYCNNCHLNKWKKEEQ